MLDSRRRNALLAVLVALVVSRVALTADSTVVAVVPVGEVGKCGLTADAVAKLLELDETDFDQSPAGFRGLGFRNCYVDAGLAVDLYISYHERQLSPVSTTALKFHAAQMYAHAGQPLYDVAARRARESVGAKSLPTWRIYVEATVAFLERDIGALKSRRDELAGTPGAPAVNLAAVDRLIKCFDRPYAIAYSPQTCAL